MDSRQNRMPAPTMTVAEAANVLGIDVGLVRQLAEDVQFPVTAGATGRLPVSQVAMLSRVLHQGRAADPIRRGSRWRGLS